MRRIFLLGLVVGFAGLGIGSSASAQFVNAGDPFFLYYSYYVPRQMMFEAQAAMGPTSQIQAQDAYHQQMTLRERAGGRGDGGGFNESMDSAADMDPTRPYSIQRERERRLNRRLNGGLVSTNQMGRGPTRFHGGARRYFPKVRAGYGPNRNLVTLTRGRGSMGGGGGMGGFPR